MTEAVRLLVECALTTLAANRLEIQCIEQNTASAFLSLSTGSRWREWGNGKSLERKKQMASGELQQVRCEALHWPFQRFCEWWFYETTVTVATM